VLSSLRVLDLTDERGQLAGQILADLGAEVILVEPPGGSSARAVGPFVEGRDGDPEASLWFWSYNRAKRSIVLDLDTDEGCSTLRRLAAGADLLIESAPPGAMAARGLGYDDLASVNPALVYTSISPFGQSGPKAGWRATDLTVVAAAMQLRMMGDEDRAPLRIPLDQAFLHASAEAAAATLIALRERTHSGVGQHVDVSAQQALMQATQSFSLAHLYETTDPGRVSGGTKVGPFHVRLRSPAADGHVSTTILFGAAIGPFSRRLFEWIHEEGGCTQADVDTDWIDFVDGVVTGRIPLTEYGRLQDVAADFTATRTKADLLASALERRLLMVPIATVADVAENPHYAERDVWRDLDVAAAGRPVRFPGPFAKLSGTPLRIESPPPQLGADTDLVLAQPARTPRPEPRAVASTPPPSGRPLEGLKVLDFMWVMAGPAGSRVLTDQGATVVRVESANKVETARTIQPFLRDEGGVDNSGLYQNMNAGKLGITLDLTKPESRPVIEDLVRWADVVCESFSPKAMRGWGLGYEDLRRIKPDIIMASTCLFGQSGPLASLAGYGTMGASLSGFYGMTGWPDREPAGCFGAYTDYVAPRFLTSAILAALDHRDRTGEGQYIDVSQAEASLHFLTPALLDHFVNGAQAAALGNRHPAMAPHGVFPVAGDDGWIAIACQDDGEWAALCDLAGFGPADRALDLAGRLADQDRIETLIAEWSAGRDGADLERRLQDAGVAAHTAQTSAQLAADPQLAHRRHFRQVDHSVHGTVWVEGPRFQMSRSQVELTHGGPSYGEHTFEVLENVLGYDADRIAELAVAGVLE